MKNTFKCTFFCLIVVFFALSAKASDYHQKSVPGADSLLNYPAPDFTLKDLSGKMVSLSDYRGKILVIDFWATWCHYCLKSFPSTQLVVDKYKDDPNVAFLFIDTREVKENYVEIIRKLLSDHHYTFNVVLDKKGPDGLQNKIFKQYGAEGVPATFIIDRDGIVRYKVLGYDEELPTDAVVKHMSELIDNVENSQSGFTMEFKPL